MSSVKHNPLLTEEPKQLKNFDSNLSSVNCLQSSAGEDHILRDLDPLARKIDEIRRSTDRLTFNRPE